MSRLLSFLYACIVLMVAACLNVNATQIQGTPETPRSVVDKYCVTCHNERLRTAGLVLDKSDIDHPGSKAEVWEKVLRKLREKEMPPPGRPRPDEATYAATGAFLERALDDAAVANPQPGRVPVHRLNRTEYRNA